MANRLRVLALVLGGCGAASTGGQSPAAGNASAVGATALVGRASAPLIPDFELPQNDGGVLNFAKLRGSVVLVDAWASYCRPCGPGLETIAALAKRFPSVVTTTISIDESPQVAVDFAKQHAPALPVAHDTTQALMAPPLKLTHVPTVMLVDRAGHIRYRRAELTKAEYAELPALIEQLLAEPTSNDRSAVAAVE